MELFSALRLFRRFFVKCDWVRITVDTWLPFLYYGCGETPGKRSPAYQRRKSPATDAEGEEASRQVKWPARSPARPQSFAPCSFVTLA